MKNKKKTGMIIFGVVCAVIVIACLVIQLVLKNEDKKLEQESEKYETLVTETKSGVKVETEYTHIDDKKFYFKVPKSFHALDYETITKKYQGNVPGVVFSNDETTINLAISSTEDSMKDQKIESYIKSMEKLLKETSEVIDTKLYKVDGHNVGQIKLVSQAADTKIYNNMIAFSYQDKLVIMTFNCTEELMDEWQSVGNFIIDSLFFTE